MPVFLYDPDDRDGLTTALLAVVISKERLETMGRHNLRRTNRLAWPRIAIETANVYQVVTQGDSSSKG